MTVAGTPKLDLKSLGHHLNLSSLGQDRRATVFPNPLSLPLSPTMPDDSLAVLKGTLEFLALRTLASGTEMHGFEILDFVHRSTEDELQLEEGALYPALHRMEKRGWLAARWGVSEKGRRAKYYRLTTDGQTALRSEEERWSRYVTAVGRLAPDAGARP